MKKLFILLLIIVLAFITVLPVFAAPSGYTKAQLITEVSKIPAVYQAQAIDVINAMDDTTAAAIDVPAVKAIAKDLQAKYNNGTLTVGDITNAKSAVEAVAPGVVIEVSNVSINGAVISAIVTVTVNGNVISKKYNISDSQGAGVIKITGIVGYANLVILALSITGLLGVAFIKVRKKLVICS